MDRLSRTLKWIFVLPVFLFSFLLFGVFFRYCLDIMIFNMILRNKSRQLDFVVHHLYDDFVAIAFSIIISCALAPKRRIAIAGFYLFVILISIPRRLELAQEHNYFGYSPWKTPFLISIYILSGAVPMIVLWLMDKKAMEEKGMIEEEHWDSQVPK